MGIRLRDPVHNFVSLSDEEVKVVDTAIFQRLRGIRQLALANLVYPGALHTRFDHSIGVCHVAGMMAEELALDPNPRQENAKTRRVRLAALLHDLGHGPFSHVSEEALERYADRSALAPEQKREKIHELITAQLIRTDEKLVQMLGQDTCDIVAQLLTQGYGEPVLRNIVSGPLDADKQDYLLRDSRFCGVPYGMFDIDQLHRSLTLGGPEDERGLWIDPDGVHAVEQYVLAKYYMTSNVYRHKVRLITDQMITRAITLGVEHDEIEKLRSIYAFDGSDEFLQRYKQWDDCRFLNRFAGEGAPKGLCREMLRCLIERHLLKRVFSDRISNFEDARAREVLANLSKLEHDGVRKKLEAEAAALASREFNTEVDPRFVILFSFNIKSVRVSARDDERSIMVATSRGPRQFDE
ncbi:MAG: HD domain-containing protein, partial [Phycisphaerae bacterium]